MTPRPATTRHLLVASLASGDRADVESALRSLPPGVDLAEVRLDHLWPGVPEPDAATDDLLGILEAAEARGIPLVATLRPTRQGGRFQGPEDVRLGLLASAGKAGFAHLDLERDAAMVPGVLSAIRDACGDARVFASEHYVGPSPCKDDCLVPLAGIQDAAGAIDKFAFPAGAYPELLRALEVAVLHGRRNGHPSVSTMGYGGPHVRALLGLVANHATYGHAPGLPPAVSGQPDAAAIEAVWQAWGLTRDELCHGAPRPWLAAIGMPAQHSQSPRLHNAWLRAAGRAERMGVLEVPASAGALKLTFHVAPRLGLQGAVVLRPHKQDAARFCQGDDAVHATLAANVVRFEGEQVLGTNTDAAGVRDLLGPCAKGGQAVVLGAGAAARAAIHALQLGGADVRFASRDVEAARIVTRHLGASWVPWERRNDVQADVWVNATPLGQAPGDASPLLASRLRSSSTVLEMSYAAGPTALEALARARGARVVGGLDLLEAQARHAYAFLTASGAPGPTSVPEPGVAGVAEARLAS